MRVGRKKRWESRRAGVGGRSIKIGEKEKRGERQGRDREEGSSKKEDQGETFVLRTEKKWGGKLG